MDSGGRAYNNSVRCYRFEWQVPREGLGEDHLLGKEPVTKWFPKTHACLRLTRPEVARG